MQLGLFADRIGAQLRETIQELGDRHGHQKISECVGMSEAALSHALNQTRRADGRLKRRLPIEALPELIALDGGEKILEVLGACAAVRKPTLRARTTINNTPQLRVVK